MIAKGVLDHAMFLYVALVAKGKHVIYLFLILTLQLLLLSGKPCPKLFHLLLSCSFSCLTFLCLASIASFSSFIWWALTSATSLSSSSFISSSTPSSTAFRVAASSPYIDFSLVQSSSLSFILWAIYVLIVLKTSSHLKSRACRCIKLRPSTTTWDDNKLSRNKNTKAPWTKYRKGLPLPLSRWLYNPA